MTENRVYQGRLCCDGYGNLLADEGDNAGEPVAFSDGVFVFVSPTEPSHNERHHQKFATVDVTTEESAGSKDSPAEGQEHHWAVQKSDSHYDPLAPHQKRLRFLPDKQASKATSHTEAYNV